MLPADAVSYDDASNNRALISGKSALIWNPPSAWAVAKRDAPAGGGGLLDLLGADGPEGPVRAVRRQSFWGVWKFAQNKTAAKELIEYLMQREQVEARCNAVVGYDMPPFASMLDFKVWEEVEPPKGTVLQLPDPAVAHGEAEHAAASRRRPTSRCRSTTAASIRRCWPSCRAASRSRR